MSKDKKINKVVLAYSGGLDTSVILKWLEEKYECEVVTFTADLGQGAELEDAKEKAESHDVKEIFIEDLKEDFVKNYVFPMFRANTLYEGKYLLGTAIARPLIAKRQIEIAHEVGADAVCHGATGKGNDQVRFELAYYGLDSNIKVIAPWREWDLNSRTKLIDFAEKHQIPITKDKRGDPSSFKIIMEVTLNLNNKINNKNFSKKFVKETSFDSMDNKFELDQYKNTIEKNMIFKILQDINIFFNFSIFI